MRANERFDPALGREPSSVQSVSPIPADTQSNLIQHRIGFDSRGPRSILPVGACAGVQFWKTPQTTTEDLRISDEARGLLNDRLFDHRFRLT